MKKLFFTLLIMFVSVGLWQTNAQTTYTSVGAPVPIPDFSVVPGVAVQTLTVPPGHTISDLDVNLDIQHTWVGDLIITLQSPLGTPVIIIDRAGAPPGTLGCNEDNILTTLDDAAALPVENECDPSDPFDPPGTVAIGAGPFTPNNPLAAFFGEDATGVWTLTVTDNAGGDSGNLNSFGVTITTCSTPPILPLNGPLSVTLDAAGNGQITYATLTTGATGVCGTIVAEGIVGLSPIPVTCADIGAGVDVDISATDSAGNTTVILATNVAVVDTTPPVAVAQDVTLTLDGAGNATLTLAAVENGSTDACGVNFPSGVLSQTLFTCADVGTSPNAETYTVDDVNGNTSAAVGFNVTVLDGGDPVLNPQAAFAIIIDPVTGLATVNYTGDLTTAPATDICGILTEGIDDDNNAATPPVASIVVGCPEALASLTAPIPVTIEATDTNGNRVTAVVPVTVTDNTPPVMDPGVPITANNDPGVCGAVINYTYAGADVNCMPVTVTQVSSAPTAGLVSGSVFPIGVTTVVMRGTSTSGFTTDISFTVTVTDNENPVAVCQDITVALDNTAGAGSYTMLPSEIDGGSTDNCTFTLAASQTVFTCTDLGPQVVTLTVTDASANTATCTANVTVVDTSAPVANCQNVTVQLDASGNGSTTAALVNNGSTDNCTVASLVLDKTAFTCDDLGANTVTLTVTDQGGLQSTCTATVTVEDNIIPVAAAKDVTLTLDASGNATLTPAMVENGSTDNCTVVFPGQIVGGGTYTCADVGTFTATYAVIDQSSNFDTVDFNVTVIDNTPPVLNPVADNAFTAVLDIALGTYDVLYTDVAAPAADACGFGTQGILDGPGGTIVPFVQVQCTDALTETVYIGATDVNGNYSEAAVVINILDPTAPIWNPVPNIIEPLDAGTCGAVVNYTITAADANCGPVTVVQIVPDPNVLESGDVFPIGVTNVTMEATNTAGVTSTVSFTVEVFDDVDPVAVCNDITVTLDGTGNVTITAMDVGSGSSDNCSEPLVMTLDDYSFDCNDVGDNTVTLTVTETLPASSTVTPRTDTCTATVTVQDNQFPTLDAKATFYIALDLINGDGTINYNPDLVNSNATDNCLIATEGIDHDNDPGTPPVASMTVDCAAANASPIDVTVEATDQWGNRTTAIVVVTVEDTSVPVFNPVPNIVEPNDPGVCGAIVNYTISAADVNCAPVTVTQLSPVSPVDGDVFPIGTTTVTMLATSTSGATSTVTFDITIEDVELPTAVCQDITVQLDASGVATITPSNVDGGSFDNCAFALSLDNDTFGCADVGDNTVTLTITDASGNPASCTATVTVEDNVAPIALCAPYTLVLDANGDGSIVPGDVDGGSSDACGIATMAVSPNTFDCSNVGVPNLVTLTVTDVNGNTSTCTTTVTVEDNTAPTAVCQAITVQLDADGDVTITGADVNDGSDDACGVASLSVSPSSFDCSNVGDNTVTLTVTDVNGNSSTCSAVVTVEDTVAPTAVCNDFDVILDAVGNASITVAEVDGGSSDACGIASMAIDVTDFTCADIGPNDVVLTVTDVNGNVSSCTAVVTVVDNIPALIACPADVVDDSDPGVCGAEVVFADASAIDVCGVVSIVQTAGLPSGSVFPIGVSTVEFTATDAGGNESVCSFTITIVDDEDPVASCVEELTVTLDEFGVASITTADIDDGSTDNCPIDFMTLSQSTFGCEDVGENTITLTVFDLSGNSSTCTTTVTVVDDIAPEIVCIGAPGDFTGMASDAPALAIPDNDDAGTTTTITVTDEFDITDLDVMVDISHTWVGDVTVKLTSPSGTEVTLIDQMGVPATTFGCSANDIDVTLDDEATDPIEDECGSGPAADGSFTPNNALSAFDGETTMGDWTLFVSDSVGGDTGTLNSWGIAYSYSLETTPPYEVVLDEDGTVTFDASELLISVNEACDYEVTGADGETTITLDCESLGLTEVEVTVTDASGNASSCVATVLVQDLTDPIITCVAAGETVPTETGSASDSPALAIPDNDPAGATTTITVADDVSITDLNVDLDISHTWVGDVTVKLTSPSGTEVTLIEQMGVPASTFGCDGDDLAVTLDDEATDPIEDACGSPTTGSFTPNDALSAFDGEMAMGDWTLFVSDAAGGDTGTVNSWGITYTYDGEPIVTESYSIFLNEEGWVLVDPFDLIADTNEACGIDVAAADRVYFTCDDVDAGVIFVTVFVSDLSGNLASCVAEVQVYDAIAPVLTCPEDQTVDPGQGNLFYELPDYIATGEATAVDNCTDPAATTQDPAPGTLLPDGEYTVAFTATDDSGNSSACEFTLTVESIILTVGDLNIGSVVMYPNPASNFVMLSNPQSLNLDRAAIYDLTGRLVQDVNLTDMGTEISIDVSYLASATYMVLIQGENGQVTKQLIKE